MFNSTLQRDIAVPVNATIEELDNIPLSEVQGFKEPALPWYSDQVLPFDITVAAANEYGAAASAKLFGVEILNEGFGSSVDDSVLDAGDLRRPLGRCMGSMVLLEESADAVLPGLAPVWAWMPPSKITAVPATKSHTGH